MNNEKVEKQLEKMKGASFLYQSRSHRVINYKETDTGYVISTDKDIFNFSRMEIESKLNLFLPVSDENVQLAVVSNEGNFKALAATLMGNIAKIQKDKEYIPQANAINESAKVLIDLAKTELIYLKMVRNG